MRLRRCGSSTDQASCWSCGITRRPVEPRLWPHFPRTAAAPGRSRKFLPIPTARNRPRIHPPCRRQTGRSSSYGSSSCRKMAAKFRSEEHTSELQSRENLVCRLLLEKKKKKHNKLNTKQAHATR